MQEKYRSKGFKVIGINLDAKTDDAKKFLAQTPAHFTVAFDSKGENARGYSEKGMPTSFLIDRNGRILLQHQGFRESDREELENSIKAALEDKR